VRVPAHRAVLIPSPRHSRADLEAWARVSRVDVALGKTRAMAAKVEAACGALEAFLRASLAGYQGVSWGKDSGACLYLATRVYARTGLRMPLVWVRVGTRENPDCLAVRDAWRARFGAALDYHEVCVAASDGAPGRLTSGDGFAEAARRFGDRHVSGVRADESRVRELSAQHHGVATARTCRPILRWSARDVYALHAAEDLPLHPAYAMSFGGALDRDRLRVASLGGDRGTGHGRRGWEMHYYGAEMAALGMR
jgi:phosphoadenosine phosphosulfate reductase